MGPGLTKHRGEVSGGNQPITPGDYKVFIEKMDLVDYKNGGGSYVKVQFRCSDTNRVIFQNFTFTNDANEKAVEIGTGQLRHILAAIGWIDFNDPIHAGKAGKPGFKDLNTLQSAMACNIPFLAEVKVKKSNNTAYQDENEIVKAWPLGSTDYTPPSGASIGVGTQYAQNHEQQRAAHPQPSPDDIVIDSGESNVPF